MVEIMNDVIIGQQDWLFLHSGGHRETEHLTGACAPAPDSPRNFHRNIETRADWCALRDLPYLHVVFPSKSYVLRRYLPAPLDQTVGSLFRRDYAPLFGTTLPRHLLYPDAELAAQPAATPGYFRHDTHLSQTGGLLVAGMALKRLGLEIDLSALFTCERGPVTGDLAEMLKRQTSIQEMLVVPRGKGAQLYDNRWFLPGNTHNVTVAHNPDAATGKRLLILGDSFFRNALPVLAEAFRDVLYIRSATFQTDVIDLFAPDAILTGNAERYLSRVAPDKGAPSALFPDFGSNDYRPSAEFRSALAAQLSFRHHPSAYRHWADAARTAPRIGRIAHDRQVEFLNPGSGLRRATGDDPIMILPLSNIRSGTFYELHLRMTSNVASTAMVFYATTAESGFSSTRVARQPVKRGVNRLVFPIDCTDLGPRLRLDPLACPGTFSIDEVELVESERGT